MVDIVIEPYTRSDFITIGKMVVKHSFTKKQLEKFKNIKLDVETNYTNFLKTRKPPPKSKYKDRKNGNYRGSRPYDKYSKKGRDYFKESAKAVNFKVENWRSYKENKPKRDEKSIEVITKRINMELNKLSANNFDKILNSILEIIESDEDLLHIVVEDLFDKAVQQKTFCEHYANLAFKLNSTECFKNKIRPILLDYCNKLYKENQSLVVVDKTTDYDKFCEYLKHKKRLIGNFQFMGELYKKSLLDFKVVEDFWNLLLMDIDKADDLKENYGECICQLLRTIGYKLEEQYTSNLEFEEKWMNPLKEFSKDKETFKPRIRFMFMDCVERKKWTN